MRQKTDGDDAQAIARETLADPGLPRLQALAEMLRPVNDLTPADGLRIRQLQSTLDEIFTITAQIRGLELRIMLRLGQIGCTLTEIHGIGAVNAMELVVEVGDPLRFATGSQFARWRGSAPIPLSSGEGHGPARRDRLDPAETEQ